MKPGPHRRWYAPPVLAVLGAQLCAALADNALLIVAIALLEARHAPGWVTPALRGCFYAAYVLLAPLAGRWADSWPKGRLMAAVNGIKLLGVAALAGGAHPLLVFAAIGCGAAAYAPARYGVLPELTSGRELLRANAAMEIVTIAGIIGGYALGSALLEGGTGPACAVMGGLFALGALATAALGKPAPDAAADRMAFFSAAGWLLRDGPARHSLVLTSIFWSAAAVLQLLMIAWARDNLGLRLAQAALLPAVLALGIVAGAVLAGAWRIIGSPSAGTGCALALGGAIMLMPLAHSVAAACALLASAGVLAGVLLVPMNAVLQERGASLLLPGMSVAVQNGAENSLSVIFLALYGAALAAGASTNGAVHGLGIGVVLLVSLGSWATHRLYRSHRTERRCQT